MRKIFNYMNKKQWRWINLQMRMHTDISHLAI